MLRTLGPILPVKLFIPHCHSSLHLVPEMGSLSGCELVLYILMNFVVSLLVVQYFSLGVDMARQIIHWKQRGCPDNLRGRKVRDEVLFLQELFHCSSGAVRPLA